MKRILVSLAATAVAITALPTAASAQQWQSVNARQERLYDRIEQGVRNGSLTRREAGNLRARFTNIQRLEGQYRRTGGLQGWERRDLNQRFDALSRSIRVQKNDRQDRRYR